MTSTNIYRDIANRTNGDIYIGVVGPVRSGKSTFIKRFMDVMVLPNITDSSMRERAKDEMPQSASGRTIMTTEPKFIPEDAVSVQMNDGCNMSVRLIDCVGYIVPSSIGYIESDKPRMVKTPWYDQPIPFNMAAEIGTQKVINEHSTIGLVITTDGSIGEIPREDYEEAEERVINELKQINKPFIVLMNTANPESDYAKQLAEQLQEKYGASVTPVDCSALDELQIKKMMSQILNEFPIREIEIKLPNWLAALPLEHWLRKSILDSVKNNIAGLSKVRDLKRLVNSLSKADNLSSTEIEMVDLGTGDAKIIAKLNDELFYKVLSDQTGVDISDEQDLMSTLTEFASMAKEYRRVKDALDEVEATGYGIVMPQIEELSLEEPEIVHQGGRYGVRLRASAPSIHMMKANINTEVSPIVGSEKQSEDLIMYLLKEFEQDPIKIWDSNIFGKSLHELVNEGLHTKLARMPGDARMKMQETVERVINEGCSGLICIIL